MSVSIGRRGAHRPSGSHREDVATRIYLWAVAVGVVALASPGVQRLASDDTRILELGLWALVVAAVDLAPISVWRSVSVSVSFPVSLAAGMLFLPTEAALVAFLGSFDPRELRGEVSLAKSLFNRSQVAASVMAGSAIFHLLGGSVLQWPEVFLPGIAALTVDAVANTVLVVGAVSLGNRVHPLTVMARMFGQSPAHYVVGYLLLGLLALPLSAAVAIGGVWALLLFLASLALAREMFRQTQLAASASNALRRKDAALREATGEVVKERRDERLRLAGELHDEVLPSLFKVHLMGQVLRQDIERGRLLELDEDLPQLLSATERAQHAIREILGDLRRSPIGAGGLAPTLRTLIDQVGQAGGPKVSLEFDALNASPLAQLLAYQVVREALYNAAKHSRAREVVVRVYSDGDLIRLSVIDDGVGFDLRQVDPDTHFGLQLMSERLEAAGGRLVVDSELGTGTTVAATIPAAT
jgi:signal transduction histidine kinase